MSDRAARLFEAECCFQLGLSERAASLYQSVLQEDPGCREAVVRLNQLQRPTPPPATGKLTVIWQVDPASPGIWEGDWLRSLLSGLDYAEVVDTRHTAAAHQSLIIDRRIDGARLDYYTGCYRTGARFALLHLGDEGFGDDRLVYEYCELVLRNYWSPVLAQQRKVSFLPLGYKSGFRLDGKRKRASERKYRWSFLGDPNKSTRPQMLDALGKVAPAFVHETAAFIDPNAMPVSEYQAVLEDSVFAPCPAGFLNLDSFRICEALECGCIPVVESRLGLDYYTALFGSGHPLLVAPDWNEARRRMQALIADPAALEARRQACARWWQDYRVRLRRDVAQTLRDALGLA